MQVGKLGELGKNNNLSEVSSDVDELKNNNLGDAIPISSSESYACDSDGYFVINATGNGYFTFQITSPNGKGIWGQRWNTGMQTYSRNDYVFSVKKGMSLYAYNNSVPSFSVRFYPLV